MRPEFECSERVAKDIAWIDLCAMTPEGGLHAWLGEGAR